MLLLAVGLTVGCSGIRPYPNTLDKNVQVRTETRSASIFSSTRASMAIYRVDPQCRVEYEGTMDLDHPLVQVGLPTDRVSYLVFGFYSSSFLGNPRSSISQETVLRTRPGHSYDIDVSYRNSLYNVVVHERQPRTGERRELELRRLSACRD